jgi:hypothetical protein
VAQTTQLQEATPFLALLQQPAAVPDTVVALLHPSRMAVLVVEAAIAVASEALALLAHQDKATTAAMLHIQVQAVVAVLEVLEQMELLTEMGMRHLPETVVLEPLQASRALLLHTLAVEAVVDVRQQGVRLGQAAAA